MANTDNGFIQIGKAKEFFELGLITGFQIVKAIQPGKWVLVMTGTEFRAWTLATKLNEAKLFSSVDTLIGQAEQVAGREIEAWITSPFGRPLR